LGGSGPDPGFMLAFFSFSFSAHGWWLAKMLSGLKLTQTVASSCRSGSVWLDDR